MSRIQVAFLLYIVLAAIAVSTLQGDFRMVVLALLAGLAIKTWIGEQKRRSTGVADEAGTRHGEPDGAAEKP